MFIDDLRCGGGGGIRTHETLTGLTVFKTAAFSHSATPPVSVSNSLAQHPSLPSPLCCTLSRKNRRYRRSELLNSNELNTISPLECCLRSLENRRLRWVPPTKREAVLPERYLSLGSRLELDSGDRS
jgi:hypothetical protein